MTGSAWLPGIVVGVAAGFASLEIPPLGWGLAVAFAIPALVVGPRLAALGGLFTGIGAIWIVLLGRVGLECRGGTPENSCEAPGIESWLAVGAAMLTVGVALSVAALARSRRRSDRS